MTTKVSKIQIYTSGMSQEDIQAGGWGALMKSGVHEKKLHGGIVSPLSDGDLVDDNTMALVAAVEGLSAVSAVSEITVYTPASYVIELATKWIGAWKACGWKTQHGGKVKNLSRLIELDCLLMKHKVTFELIAGVETDPVRGAKDLAEQGLSLSIDVRRTAPVAVAEAVPLADVKPDVAIEATDKAVALPSDDMGCVTESDKDLLRLCLPMLCAGLSLEFLVQHAPDCLAVRVAAACR